VAGKLVFKTSDDGFYDIVIIQTTCESPRFQESYMGLIT